MQQALILARLVAATQPRRRAPACQWERLCGKDGALGTRRVALNCCSTLESSCRD